jgi:23S rRNA A1618 N6-methylase RlmF
MADLLAEGERYDFTMCNPPFFAERSEMVGNRSGHRPQPSSVCTGTESEILTSGGEVTFVGKMIDDSLKLGSRIKYVVMFAKYCHASSHGRCYKVSFSSTLWKFEFFLHF